MKKAKKGFTLVELLVVIAILAILATVSVVGYISFINRANESDAQTEAHQIEQIIKSALILDEKIYIKKSDNYFIVCTREGNDYVVSKSITKPTDATKITDIPENLINGLEYIDVGGLTYTSDKGVVIVIKIPTNKVSKGLEFELNSDGVSYYVKSIGECTDTDIVIPDTYNDLPVTSIGERAFERCTTLTSIDIPDSVISIGLCAFNVCESLTSIEIPNSVTSIGLGAFADCTSLTSIEIPDSVTSIPEQLFYGCTSLASIDFPNSATSIGNKAFYNCSSLISIVIGESVTSIGQYAFNYCSSLMSIVIGESLTDISTSAFRGCTSLISIEVDANNQNYKSIDGNLYTIDEKELVHYAVGKEATSYTISDSVTSIRAEAFYGGITLTSIEIPDSVTKIGKGAFLECTSLTNIVIPNSVISIVTSAFSGCTSLTNINFDGTVEQWNAISKVTGWDNNTGDYTIYCTDGQIAKDGTVTYK